LNPMIKVVNLVSVIIAPMVVQIEKLGPGEWAAAAVMVALLAWSILSSKSTAKVAAAPAKKKAARK
ncbi:MAG: hypothetical protein KIT29_05490, partial [Anaerolineales bacterium]|nr:hypothetical protein [Anaerolineales bacterium]